MAHTKAAGSTRLGRDSQPKYLGVKLFAGQPAKAGSIIVRQRGTKFIPGRNTRLGSDHTVYSIAEGIVKYTTKRLNSFTGAKKISNIVSVAPAK